MLSFESVRAFAGVAIIVEQNVVQKYHRVEVRAAHDAVLGNRVPALVQLIGQMRVEYGSAATDLSPVVPHLRRKHLCDQTLECRFDHRRRIQQSMPTAPRNTAAAPLQYQRRRPHRALIFACIASTEVLVTRYTPDSRGARALAGMLIRTHEPRSKKPAAESLRAHTRRCRLLIDIQLPLQVVGELTESHRGALAAHFRRPSS